MSDQVAICVENVSKTFRLPHEKHNSLKGLIVNFYRRKKSYELQRTLKNISFEVKQGEFFGIVGRNGSGKSTLLKLLAGIYTPDKGLIHVNGSLTPFIELGVGFNPELTGRENVFLNGALLGFNRKQMQAMYDEIVEFAELERFMDQKLKNYSSGMQVRLAFSIAIRARSAILLLDEVLAVGDAIFQKKCYDYFKQLKKEKRTVIFVSHDISALQEYCDRSILIEDGRIVRTGEVQSVVKDYLDIINKVEGKLDTESTTKKSRWGSGKAHINHVMVSSDGSQPQKLFKEKEDIHISATFTANEIIGRPVIGVTISDLTGQVIFQSNTLWCKVKVPEISPGVPVDIHWRIPNAFNSGTYNISPAISDPSGSEIYEWLEDVAQFKVSKQQKSHGIVNIEHELSLSYDSKTKHN